jgi:hypothetical protein
MFKYKNKFMHCTFHLWNQQALRRESLMKISNVQFGRRVNLSEQVTIEDEVMERFPRMVDDMDNLEPKLMFVHDHQVSGITRGAIIRDIVKDMLRCAFWLKFQPKTTQTFDSFIIFRPKLSQMQWFLGKHAEMKKTELPDEKPDLMSRLLGFNYFLKDFAKINDSEILQHYRLVRTSKR